MNPRFFLIYKIDPISTKTITLIFSKRYILRAELVGRGEGEWFRFPPIRRKDGFVEALVGEIKSSETGIVQVGGCSFFLLIIFAA